MIAIGGLLAILAVVAGVATLAASIYLFATWLTARDEGEFDEHVGKREHDHYTGRLFKAYLSGIAKARREKAIRESRKDVTY